MATDRWEINGISLAVTTAGPPDGPVVLLLHGFPDRASMWRGVIPSLAQAGYRVLAPDLRGFGDSDKPERVEAYRMRTVVADVVGLLDAAGVPGAHIVGHDWGASLAWATAMFAPERARSLCALSAGHAGTRAFAGLEQSERSWYMLWFLLPGVAEQAMPRDDWAFLRRWGWREPGGEADLRRQIDDLSRPGALRAALGWYRANIDPVRFVESEPSDLPQVRCPTMGIWSTRDPFLGEAQMSESHRFVAGPWRYEVVEGVDHWIPVRAPDRVAALLLDFLGTPSTSHSEGADRS